MDKLKNIKLANELFRELYSKILKLENKKYLYKDLEDLTVIEINTILVIGPDDKKSMSEIANKLGVTSGTPTVTIDRLINKGYVERIRDLEDRRQVFVKLSSKGIKIFEEVVELKTRVGHKVFGVLSDSEIETLIEAMSKINNMFEDLF